MGESTNTRRCWYKLVDEITNTGLSWANLEEGVGYHVKNSKILHKVAIANVIVNNFYDIVSETATSVNEEVLNSLIKQEEKGLEKIFGDLPEDKKQDELDRAERFQYDVLDLLEELTLNLKEK